VRCGERRLYEIRKLFGVLFQDGALFGSMNLYDNPENLIILDGALAPACRPDALVISPLIPGGRYWNSRR
jgi:ABC-type transporter Mla maintaining outer membrane lipid asymmetry ATPase subunit MlaF